MIDKKTNNFRSLIARLHEEFRNSDSTLAKASRFQEEFRNSDSTLAKAARLQEEFRNSNSILAKTTKLQEVFRNSPHFNSVAISAAAIQKNLYTSDSLKNFVSLGAELQNDFKSDTFKNISDPLDTCDYLRTSDTFKKFSDSARFLRAQISSGSSPNFSTECYEYIDTINTAIDETDKIFDINNFIGDSERTAANQKEGNSQNRLNAILTIMMIIVEIVKLLFPSGNTYIHDNGDIYHINGGINNFYLNDNEEISDNPKDSIPKTFE